jgi:putative ABC transport system ATP-binding protein
MRPPCYQANGIPQERPSKPGLPFESSRRLVVPRVLTFGDPIGIPASRLSGAIDVSRLKPTRLVLHIRGLSKSYGGVRPRTILRGIDLDLGHGVYLAIRGESGVGKSTLLNLIAGLELPDSGSLLLGGVDIARLDDRARTLLRRSHIGFVFQAFHLLAHLTVGQNVALPLALNRTAPGAIRRRTAEMLEAVGLGAAADAYPRELSGGEMQRVAIARSLIHRPALVLADEPTGNLDPDAAVNVTQLLREQIKTQAVAGILVTHSARAAATADSTLTLTADGLQRDAAG